LSGFDICELVAESSTSRVRGRAVFSTNSLVKRRVQKQPPVGSDGFPARIIPVYQLHDRCNEEPTATAKKRKMQGFQKSFPGSDSLRTRTLDLSSDLRRSSPKISSPGRSESLHMADMLINGTGITTEPITTFSRLGGLHRSQINS
jgi:hypothetical protein